MSLLNDLLTRVIALTNRLNQIGENSKTNEELPRMLPLVRDALVRGSISGTSKTFTIEELIDDIAGDLTLGNVPVIFKPINIDFESPGSVRSKLVQALNSAPNYELAQGTLYVLYVQRIVLTNSGGIGASGGPSFSVITENYLLTQRIRPQGTEPASIGVGGTTVLSNGVRYLNTVDTRSFAPVDFDLGDIGTSSVSDAVNLSGPYSVPNGTTVLFKAIQNGEPKIWLYRGAQEEIGTGETPVSEIDFRELTGSSTDPYPVPVLEIWKSYGTVQEMIDRQGEQTGNEIIEVKDAIGDTNIEFEASETRRQAMYRRKMASENGNLSDYVLESVPYGNGGGEIPTFQQVLDASGAGLSASFPSGQYFEDDGNTLFFGPALANIMIGQNRDSITFQQDKITAVLDGDAGADGQAIGKEGGKLKWIEVGLGNRKNKEVSTTTYILQEEDKNKILLLKHVDGCDITVPSGLTDGNRYEGKQLGGDLDFIEDGVVIHTVASEEAKTNETHAVWALDSIAEDEYDLYGRLKVIEYIMPVKRKSNKEVMENPYTLRPGDVNFILISKFNVDSVIVVPLGLPANVSFEGKQRGDGQISFIGEAGVTVNTNSINQTKTLGKFSPWALDWYSNSEYDLYGELELI